VNKDGELSELPVPLGVKLIDRDAEGLTETAVRVVVDCDTLLVEEGRDLSVAWATTVGEVVIIDEDGLPEKDTLSVDVKVSVGLPEIV